LFFKTQNNVSFSVFLGGAIHKKNHRLKNKKRQNKKQKAPPKQKGGKQRPHPFALLEVAIPREDRSNNGKPSPSYTLVQPCRRWSTPRV